MRVSVCVCARMHVSVCVCVCLKLDIVLVGSFCMLLICDPVGVCVWGCLRVYMCVCVCVCVCVCSFLSLKLLDYSQMTGLEWMCGVQVILYYGYILFLMLYVDILLCVGDYIYYCVLDMTLYITV